jgi:murein DD-endopeptidase MepM/ murein hydrolase activator NlpD
LLASLISWGAAPTAFARAGDIFDTYIVAPGDTLSRIAARYQVTVAELAAANHLADVNRIRAGQTLVIPRSASSPVTPSGGSIPHRVQAGETLSILAARYGTTVAALVQANGLTDPDRLAVGQLLLVPTAVAPETPTLPAGPITAVQVTPPVVEQGDTILVRVLLDAAVSLEISLDGLPLRLAQADGEAWTVAPIGALAPPGRKELRLRATMGDATTELIWPVWVVQSDYAVQHITLPPAKGDLLDARKLQEEREKLAAVWSQSADRPLWDGVFATPLAPGFPTSSAYGVRRSYNGGPVSSFHEGHDFSAAEGTPVVAPAAGRVVLAEPLTVRGNAVILDHGLGVHTGYWHLSRIDVAVGQEVRPGDLLGLVGTTGLSTGAHLHWELRIGDVPVDPMTWTRRTFP